MVAWNVTPCSLVHRYQYFGGTWCVCLYPEDGQLVPVYQTMWCHLLEDWSEHSLP
jgi:hypothetical protein